jgi:uncharacterized protein YggT (Ycf19 family)
MRTLASAVDVLVRIFALGLFVHCLLSWVGVTKRLRERLEKVYAPFLNPIRKVIKPVELKTSPPTLLDIAPLLLMLLVWWFVRPFLIWVLVG